MSNATPEMKPKPKKYGHQYNPEKASDTFALELESRLAQAIYDRTTIDERMIQDLRQYKGVYDPDVADLLNSSASRSKVFVNITRPKTNAAEAQMVDLLFPNSSDKNWALKATPIPELVRELEDDSPAVIGGMQYQDEDGNIIKNSDLAKRKRELAEEAASAMEREINDQLVESRYNTKSRQVIHDGCVVGTGIIKGPVISGKMHRVYRQMKETGSYAAIMRNVFVPSTTVVRPWDFYPDMSGATMDEAEFTFERLYMTRKQVRNLRFRKGYPEAQLRKVLEMSAAETQHNSTAMNDIRRLAGLNDSYNDTRYEVWEYHGPIPENLLVEFGVKEVGDNDPMKETSGVIVYCGGVILSVKLHLIDLDVPSVYHVWNWEIDDTCIFGYGVPRLMRDMQKIMNTSWRATLDNAAITSGPQVGVRSKHIEPMDAGNWELTPFKMWRVREGGSLKEALQGVEFNNHQQELLNIYQVARQMTDEVTGIPMLQQGEQGETTPVLGGMSMLMNAANTVRRNQVKQWDDRITTPLITSFYDFNMQYSDKEEIKGDYEVDARGTSALLVRESLANAIMNLMNLASASPMWSNVIMPKARDVLASWAKTQQLPEHLIPTEEELTAWQKQQENQPQQQSPAEIAAQVQLQIEQIRQASAQQKHEADRQDSQADRQFEAALKEAELETKRMIAQVEYQKEILQQQTELMRLASNEKISSEQLATKLKELEMKTSADLQKFSTEIDLKFTQPTSPRANDGLE